MLEFLDKNFKVAIIIKDVKENMVVMIEKKGYLNRGMKTVQENQMNILELKSRIFEMKNSLDSQ